MNSYNDYGFMETTHFHGSVAQINWHMDRFRDATKKAINENTVAIKENTAAIVEQTQTQTNDAAAMRVNQTTLFGNLIKTIKGLFSKDKDASISGESFYEMVQRENDETQAYLDKYDKNSKLIADHTNTIGSNTKVIGDNLKTIGDNTKSINTSLGNVITQLESIKTQDKDNADKITAAINNLKLIVNIPSND